jgi:hypothetical protein
MHDNARRHFEFKLHRSALRSRFIVNSILPPGSSRHDSTALMYAAAGQRSKKALAV